MPKEKLTLKSDFHKYSQYGHAAVDWAFLILLYAIAKDLLERSA